MNKSTQDVTDIDADDTGTGNGDDAPKMLERFSGDRLKPQHTNI